MCHRLSPANKIYDDKIPPPLLRKTNFLLPYVLRLGGACWHTIEVAYTPLLLEYHQVYDSGQVNDTLVFHYNSSIDRSHCCKHRSLVKLLK